MANIVKEEIDVTAEGNDHLRVVHTQIHDDGIDMGNQLVVDRTAVAWLVDELTKAADVWGYNKTLHTEGPDNLKVYVGGSDMQPFVHLHNKRDPEAPEGRLYALGMSPDVARDLATKLGSA